MEREQKRIKLIKAIVIICCIIVGVTLGLSLAACMPANTETDKNIETSEYKVGDTIYADDVIYVYSLYDESEYNRYSYREYKYYNATLTQYENYFVIEYKIEKQIYTVTYSNSAFGYAYGGKKK